jgi:addiction module HigA family antidote
MVTLTDCDSAELAGEMNFFLGSALTHLLAAGIGQESVEENLRTAVGYINKELLRIGAGVCASSESYTIELNRLIEKIGNKYIGKHPGVYLRDLILDHGMTASDVARKIDCPVNRITAIMHGERGVSANSASRLGFIFSEISPLEWKILQSEYDIRKAEPVAKQQVPDWKLHERASTLAS